MAGFFYPVLGTAAAAGLALLMIGALVFHLRSGDHCGLAASILLD